MIKENLVMTGSRFQAPLREDVSTTITTAKPLTEEYTPLRASDLTTLRASDYKNPEKYWTNKQLQSSSTHDMVVIHVCDENRQVTRDFNCCRDILVSNMKYFKSYLSSAGSLDDVDISVHCDVEIFEWLMQYIHDSFDPPKLDKAIVVSILISSEFLQMEPLVEVCLQYTATHLNEIIKLPIDLSCISEKLLNKLTILTPPRILAATKDKKDKILNKLYKRRVEIDFSRKMGSKNGSRSIASRLTCCQHCGFVYLENFDDTLYCSQTKPYLDFRGKLCFRHLSISNWSLTGYLKALHAGGMTWEAIYWHVWAACQIFQVADISISALETDRYRIEEDCIVFNTKTTTSEHSVVSNSQLANSQSFLIDSDLDRCIASTVRLYPTSSPEDSSSHYLTETLNPMRPPGILYSTVFSLLNSQMKLIAGLAHKHLIEATGHAVAKSSISISTGPLGYQDLLWPSEGDNAIEDKFIRGRPRAVNPAAATMLIRAVSSDAGGYSDTGI